ncbi:MAG: hypothetical protein ACM3YE_14050 [Bacteroidota bacterium]
MVDEMMDEAFQLFEEAEIKIGNEISESIGLFRRAACKLLSTYLMIKGSEGEGDLDELFQECIRVNPDFEIIQSEIEYLAEVSPEEADGEELTDKANEIWDFIEGLLIEDELEDNI